MSGREIFDTHLRLPQNAIALHQTSCQWGKARKAMSRSQPSDIRLEIPHRRVTRL